MTSSFLQSELTSLIADSKKKFNDVRTAAERSLSELKGITVTSETQLAADLARRLFFIDPFILACGTRSPKLANAAATCLQRLVASRAVPSDRLEEVLHGLQDIVNASYDVQLKILQTLPALLQLYSAQIHGTLLARTLELCATLQASKTSLVSSSAGATLWQLITSIFEQATKEVEEHDTIADEVETTDEPASTSADDAGRLFEDLCATLNQTEPTFIQTSDLSPAYLVETLERVIDANASYIRSKPYLIESCCKQLVPALASLLETREEPPFFALLLQTSHIMLRRLVPLIFGDIKIILTVVLRFTDRDAAPLWKRSMALEFFAQIFANFGLVAGLFDHFKEEDSNVVVDALGTFVRIASEDPTLIGLGRQSTVPAQQRNEDDLAAIEAQGAGGLASVTSADASVTGISLDFSALETPLFDSPDATKINTVPKTYPHTLILDCISSFCEGLSKFIMPLSVLARNQDEDSISSNGTDRRSDSMTRTSSQRRQVQKHKYQRLANPLNMRDLPQLPQVQACARMVESCWPAVLAMCSTFLNAALDSHFYHVLIRSMQKLTQVSGTLELSTPRDALLTSLAKGSVPANSGAVIQLLSPVAKRTQDAGNVEESKTPLKSPPLDARRQSVDSSQPTLNIRHLLCLRALLNLGIALGPTLGQESWFIVIETLQQVEALMTIASIGSSGSERSTTITSEMAAVNTAAKRMFDSTKSYSDDAFAVMVRALLRLMGEPFQDNGVDSDAATISSPMPLASPGALSSPVVRKHGHHKSRSVSGLWLKTRALDIEVTFVFEKLKDVARGNLFRFAALSSQSVTWDLVVPRILAACSNVNLSDHLRLLGASTVDYISREVFKIIKDEALTDAEINALQCLCLQALADQTSELLPTDEESELPVETQKRAFEALEDILGHSGETLHDGWKIVFHILRCSFPTTVEATREAGSTSDSITAATPVAFRCVQLICNDFVELLDLNSLRVLMSLLYLFGAQQRDLNMALTTTGLLRNIASLLQGRLEEIDVSEDDFNDPINGETMPTSPLQLWCAALNELAKMCSDERREVRDASLRILLQAIDTASGQLTPKAWRALLECIPFSICQDYQAALNQDHVDKELLMASAAHLMDGLTTLLVQNVSAIAKDEAFADTWSRLMDIFNVTLERGELSTFPLVHNCVSRLLKAVSDVEIKHAPFIAPALMLWTWHPVPEQQRDGKDEANQAALSAHLHTFVEAYATSPEAVKQFTHHRRSISEYATTAIKKTLITATHPPYTNDVRTMTSEQQEVIKSLEILKVLFHEEPENFTGFVLELIQDMLDIEKGSLKQQSEQPATGKRSQKPTYIAVTSHCIALLHTMIDLTKSRPDYPSRVQLPYALDMLSAMIKTKYTSLPTNALAPLWRDATTTATSLLEALATLPTSQEDLTDLAQTAIATLTAILGSGGLAHTPTPNASQITPPQQPSPSTLTADESFDITHFTRFHRAAIPLISSPSPSPALRTTYVHALFSASLLSPPFPGDLAPSFPHIPLQNLTKPRLPTVRTPTYVRRQTIAYAALDALFNLLTPASDGWGGEDLAKTAAGFVLVRVALPLKAFVADQRLRGWSELHHVGRRELVEVLRRVVGTRVWDTGIEEAVRAAREADANAVASADGGSDVQQRGLSAGVVGTGGGGGGSSGQGEGKALMRVLYRLVLDVQREWRGAMRLPGGEGWMDREGGEGREIEALLERWLEVVGEGWGV